MIDYDKALSALDEWLALHSRSQWILSGATERLFLSVFGKPFKFSQSDNVVAVMSKFNILLMREIIKDLKKC